MASLPHDYGETKLLISSKGLATYPSVYFSSCIWMYELFALKKSRQMIKHITVGKGEPANFLIKKDVKK
jgi:hypothetical protein